MGNVASVPAVMPTLSGYPVSLLAKSALSSVADYAVAAHGGVAMVAGKVSSFAFPWLTGMGSLAMPLLSMAFSGAEWLAYSDEGKAIRMMVVMMTLAYGILVESSPKRARSQS